MREKIQKFGGFLGAMVMPGILAFIAWGLLTALFIPTGWIPNEDFAKMVDPMIKYLLPLIIAFNGGRIVYGHRGSMVGATVTMAAIVSSTVPTFIGAMAVAPASAYLIKKVDEFLQPRTKQGFEMLVNNFSAGILAFLLMIPTYLFVGPAVDAITDVFGSGVDFLVENGVLFLTSVIVEPAKILFLNNAINHGVFTPLGTIEAAETGKSILFLIESNPGPGLGVLLAYTFVGKGSAKASAPGAAIIHFFGGIHEIYFPYVLMKPLLVLAVIAGGMSGVLMFSLFDAGLVSPASPGSIFALMTVSPKGGWLPVLAGVAVATAVSFFVSSIILKFEDGEEIDFEEAIDKTSALKGTETRASVLSSSNVKNVVFACDAGMGSSAMGASLLRKKLSEQKITGVTVKNCAIKELSGKEDVVFTQKTLTNVAKQYAPNAKHISVDNFLSSPEYGKFIASIK